MKRIDVCVSPECHEKLRYLAVEYDTSIRALVTAVTKALADGHIKPSKAVEIVEREIVAFGPQATQAKSPSRRNNRRKRPTWS